MNKKIILLLISILCLCIVFTGCQSKSNNTQNKYANDEKFTDEEIIEDVLNIANAIKNDIENKKLTIVTYGENENWKELDISQKYLIYANSSKLTEKQKDIADKTATLVFSSQMYLERLNSSTMKESFKIGRASCRERV